jgi:ribosomal protein S8
MIKSVLKTIISLKNASNVNHIYTIVCCSPLVLNLLNLLYKEGFIQSFSIEKIKNKYYFKVFLRYCNGLSAFSNLKAISSVSSVKYIKYRKLAQTPQGLFFVVLATDKMFLSLDDCKKFKIGGIVLFSCI